jgi:hypothetical protein
MKIPERELTARRLSGQTFAGLHGRTTRFAGPRLRLGAGKDTRHGRENPSEIIVMEKARTVADQA